MLKPVDKVICIDFSHLDESIKLLPHTIYTVKLNSGYKTYHSVPLLYTNYDYEYNSNRFILLKEYRKQKLNQICSNQETK